MIMTNDSAIEKQLRVFIKNLESAVLKATGYKDDQSVIYGLSKMCHEQETNRHIPRFEYRETDDSESEFYDVMYCDNRQYVAFFLQNKDSELKEGAMLNPISCYVMLKKNACETAVCGAIINSMRRKHPEIISASAIGVNDVFKGDIKKSIVNAEDFKFNTLRIDLKVYSNSFCG